MVPSSIPPLNCFHFDNFLANCNSPTCSSQCRRLVQLMQCHVLSCLCDNPCKRSQAICHETGALCPLAGFCLSLYSMHVLNRDINMIQTNKQNKTKLLGHLDFNVKGCLQNWNRGKMIAVKRFSYVHCQTFPFAFCTRNRERTKNNNMYVLYQKVNNGLPFYSSTVLF